MSGSMTDDLERGLLDASLDIGLFSVTAPLYVELLTALGTDATAGTKVGISGYAPQTSTFEPGNPEGALRTARNAAKILYPAMDLDVSVVGWEIRDSSATPKRLWHGNFLDAPFFIAKGLLFAIPARTLIVKLS